jgi:hypothetical protein
LVWRKSDKLNYVNQPAIAATNGSVPLAGTTHLYTVNRVLWPKSIESFLESLFVGRVLHVCCGKSKLGDVRLDLNEPGVDICCDGSDMSNHVGDDSFATTLCDPPYNGQFQWNHNLLSELARVASQRIIFQHWFIPATSKGLYKKAQEKFALSQVFVWQPTTYFGRAQIVSVFDRRDLSQTRKESGVEAQI